MPEIGDLKKALLDVLIIFAENQRYYRTQERRD